MTETEILIAAKAWNCGKDTCDIAKLVHLKESQVASATNMERIRARAKFLRAEHLALIRSGRYL